MAAAEAPCLVSAVMHWPGSLQLTQLLTAGWKQVPAADAAAHCRLEAPEESHRCVLHHPLPLTAVTTSRTVLTPIRRIPSVRPTLFTHA